MGCRTKPSTTQVFLRHNSTFITSQIFSGLVPDEGDFSIEVGDTAACDVIAKSYTEILCMVVGEVDATATVDVKIMTSQSQLHLVKSAVNVESFRDSDAKVNSVGPLKSKRTGGWCLEMKF